MEVLLNIDEACQDEIKTNEQLEIEMLKEQFAKINARLSRIEASISPRGANEKTDKEALDNSLEGINRLMFLLKNGLQKGD